MDFVRVSERNVLNILSLLSLYVIVEYLSTSRTTALYAGKKRLWHLRRKGSAIIIITPGLKCRLHPDRCLKSVEGFARIYSTVLNSFFFQEKIYSDKIRNNLGNGSFPWERREEKISRTGTSTHFRYGDLEASGFFFWRYVSQISVSFAPYLDRRVVGCTSTRFLSWRVNLDPLFLQLAGSPFCRQRPTSRILNGIGEVT